MSNQQLHRIPNEKKEEKKKWEKSHTMEWVCERERKYIYTNDWTKTISQPISVLLKTEYDTTAAQDRRRNKKNQKQQQHQIIETNSWIFFISKRFVRRWRRETRRPLSAAAAAAVVVYVVVLQYK